MTMMSERRDSRWTLFTEVYEGDHQAIMTVAPPELHATPQAHLISLAAEDTSTLDTR